MGGVRVFVLFWFWFWGVGVEEQVYSTESHWYVLKWAVDSLRYADNLMNRLFVTFRVIHSRFHSGWLIHGKYLLRRHHFWFYEGSDVTYRGCTTKEWAEQSGDLSARSGQNHRAASPERVGNWVLRIYATNVQIPRSCGSLFSVNKSQFSYEYMNGTQMSSRCLHYFFLDTFLVLSLL